MADGFIPSKDKTSVSITIDGDDVLDGSLFIPSHERLVDVLNDERMFLPFETTDGEFLVINKAIVRTIANRQEARSLRIKAE
jgi:hypothetical protein